MRLLFFGRCLRPKTMSVEGLVRKVLSRLCFHSIMNTLDVQWATSGKLYPCICLVSSNEFWANRKKKRTINEEYFEMITDDR